jgi:hypothetical protein
MGELLARITNTMVIIKESYAAYDYKVPEPPTDAHGLGQVGLLEATATQWKNDMLSIDKYDLGLAKDFKHKIHLKTQDPVYRKQFKIPEAHHQFIEQTLDEWLKLGVVKRSNSLYNSPIFCVPKKQGQGLRIVQDFRELNQNSHIDKYSMKEIAECIGDI